MTQINVYCDESCHLENDHIKAMTLGAVWCDKQAVKRICEQIKQLKTAYCEYQDLLKKERITGTRKAEAAPVRLTRLRMLLLHMADETPQM